jgi:hypothetical protein
MGFMDKAKRLADQAQAKLDEVQKQFNESQSGSSPAPTGPAVEYDKHGRPIAREADAAHTTATPQQGDPIVGAPPPPPADKTPHVVDTDSEPPQGDPLRSGEHASRHGADADRGEKPPTPPAPPAPGGGLTSGDPLAG